MKNNSGSSLIKTLLWALGICVVIGLSQTITNKVETMVDMDYDTHYIENLPKLKTTIPLIKQWIEAKENWCKSNKDKCKIMKGNNGFCYDCFHNASDFGVSWPSDWENFEVTGLFTSKTTSCGNELDCSNDSIFCSAMHARVYCRRDRVVIIGALKEVSNYPLGNQLSCVARVQDQQGNDFCKEISGKEPVSLNYNFEREEKLAAFMDYCKDPKNSNFCEETKADIISKHPLNEFNYYPLD